MPSSPFILVTPGATRGIGLALTRQYLRTTNLPVYASHRTQASVKEIKNLVLGPLADVDPERLNLLHLDLTSEESIGFAAHSLSESFRIKGLQNPYIHTAFISGGILVPEKKPADLDLETITQTFQINIISHLLIIKHFWRFLPSRSQKGLEYPAKWAHISARVGSIEDNRRGGWYSYRASKAALNQVVKTFDLHLEQSKMQAICVGVHPGTVKTDLSKEFWATDVKNDFFEPADAALNLIDVVKNLSITQRGKLWDWAGKEVPW
ncbi:hypothetical protein GALMADRAFT_55769 [Galerina marginata CBS 339.88]|uniref:Uncharacterized protein n=1 Tax=Galerina marginata (strain CBS 339.88) TaxID=685588 RepID=A0A067TWI4_GALM3|nr:hypothetical protein GALMADRAFT_55769 [Galerina marginata CBS 339.88]